MKGWKNKIKKERGTNRKKFLNTETKLRVKGVGVGDRLNGGWTLRRALVGRSTGCYM